jgi:hypothetical protein
MKESLKKSNLFEEGQKKREENIEEINEEVNEEKSEERSEEIIEKLDEIVQVAPKSEDLDELRKELKIERKRKEDRPLTTRLTYENYDFLEDYAFKMKTSKSALVDKIISLFRESKGL